MLSRRRPCKATPEEAPPNSRSRLVLQVRHPQDLREGAAQVFPLPGSHNGPKYPDRYLWLTCRNRHFGSG